MDKKVFVIGGCRSGKSRQALETAETLSSTNPVFIATCTPSDDEMKQRIARHQQERSRAWRTVEAPLQLVQAIADAGNQAGVLLVDCLTLWINNQLMANHDPEHILEQIERLTRAVEAAKCPVILVSNEVGTGIVPQNRLARLYRDLVGTANQAVARCVDQVVWVVAGIPVTIKG
jgi:adenosylcobinamide kinase/adenosylcobinamide-phosphate guanylyltransferase